jgi:hypothetical protein
VASRAARRSQRRHRRQQRNYARCRSAWHCPVPMRASCRPHGAHPGWKPSRRQSSPPFVVSSGIHASQHKHVGLDREHPRITTSGSRVNNRRSISRSKAKDAKHSKDRSHLSKAKKNTARVVVRSIVRTVAHWLVRLLPRHPQPSIEDHHAHQWMVRDTNPATCGYTRGQDACLPAAPRIYMSS